MRDALRNDMWIRKHMARLSLRQVNMLAACIKEIRMYQRGPADLMLLRFLLSDRQVCDVLERLGADPAKVVQMANAEICDVGTDAEELLKPLWSIVASTRVHSKYSNIAEVSSLELLIAVSGEARVANILGTWQISRYKIVCNVVNIKQRLTWWQRVVDARRLAALPSLQRDHCHIMMHNDSYTTKEFVEHVLQHHFGMSESIAQKTMTLIHTSRWQRIATVSNDVARATIATIGTLAAAAELPLRLSTHPSIAPARLVAGVQKN
jgi:ATP-dependent Clp protease adaptor protein ClpS